MSSNVSLDVNGDGKMDDNDRYGLLYQRDTMSSFYNGCGGIIASKDEDDLPVMTLNTDRSYIILDKLYDYLYNLSLIHIFTGSFGRNIWHGASRENE